MGVKIDKVAHDSVSCACIKFDSDNYEGGIQYISILRAMARQMGDSLTIEEQFALRFDLRGLMRIARISRPGALYGASARRKILRMLTDLWAIRSISGNRFGVISLL